MSNAPKLSKDQQVYIIQSLACFHSISRILTNVKQEYNIDLTKQAVSRYDPNTINGHKLSDEFKKIFNDTRQQYLAQITTIGIAHQKVRLEKLETHINNLETKTNPNIPLIAELLEQAARECGGMYIAKNFQPIINTNIDEHEDASISDAERSEQLNKLAALNVSGTEEGTRQSAVPEVES